MRELDRIKKGLASFVRSQVSGVDYLGMYACRVQGQAGQTLELHPDDTRLPDLQGVPIRLGLPQAEVTVAVGSRVLLGWENGDPQRPFAGLWDLSTVTELRLNGTSIVLNGGSMPVARVGDTVGASEAMGIWMTAVAGYINGIAPGTAPLPSDFGVVNAGANGVLA